MSSSVGTIPGGRQRAASDGDVIDEDDDEALADDGRVFNYQPPPQQQQLSPSHRKVNQSLLLPSGSHSDSNHYSLKAGTIGPSYTSSHHSDRHKICPNGSNTIPNSSSNNSSNSTTNNNTIKKHVDVSSSSSVVGGNNSKKKNRKTSFKNVKNFVSRVVMRQSSIASSNNCNNDSRGNKRLPTNNNNNNNHNNYNINTGASASTSGGQTSSGTIGITRTRTTNNNASISVEDGYTVVNNGGTTSTSSSLPTCSQSLVTTPMNAMSLGGSSCSISNNTTVVPVTISVTGGGMKGKDFYSNHCESTSRPLLTKNNNTIPSNGFSRNSNNTSNNNTLYNSGNHLHHLSVWGDRTPGTTGLHNHGNTCFMNAVLQCLSNAGFLSGYFVTGRYKDALQNNKNHVKKSGTKGEVTDQLGTLLRSIWSGKYNADISSEFKSVAGKYNPQYKGSDQHDAQEFLLWLLDRVHEDLYSPGKKNKSSKQDGFLSEDDGATELDGSNPSFIYQLFRGLYRSSLTCLKCKRQSHTYDPYLCLSLPLPQIPDRAIYIIIVYHDFRAKVIKTGVLLKNTDTVGDLRCCLANFTSISKSQFILCQIESDGLCSTLTDSQSISDISEAENVYLFELPVPVLSPSSSISSHSGHVQPGGPSYQMSLVHILLIHVERINGSAATTEKCVRFCCPQLLSVPRDISYTELQRKILQSMGSALKEDISTQSLSKQNVLFKLQVIDGMENKDYLPHDVEMPLYMPVVDRALSACDSNPELAHIKLIVEWETRIREMIVCNKEEIVEEQPSVMKVRNAQQKMGNTSLEECFHLYTQEEELSGDAWRCPHCHKDQQGAIKNLRLWSLPGILVVHLKRFKQVKMQRNKLNILVEFPMWGLDLGQHLVTSTGQHPRTSNGHRTGSLDYGLSEPEDGHRDVYDLFAVCNHYGNMSGGHYTAFCKNPIDGSWYQYDDSRVKPISKNDVVTKAAYLLFYQRRSLFNRQTDEVQRGSHWIYPLHGISLNTEEPPLPPVRTTSRASYRSSTPPTPRWRQRSLPPPLSSVRSMYHHHHPPPPPPVHMAPVAVLESQGTIGTQVRTITSPSSSYFPYADSSSSRSACTPDEDNEDEDEPHPSLMAGAFNDWHKNGGQSCASNPTVKKYATIARTESPSHLDQFGPNDQAFMARSRTCHDIESHSQPQASAGANSRHAPPKTNGRMTPSSLHSSRIHLQHSHSADSQLVSSYKTNSHAKWAYKMGSSQGSASRSLSENEHHQRLYYLTKYKRQQSAFHQEKLSAPCLKESSV